MLDEKKPFVIGHTAAVPNISPVLVQVRSLDHIVTFGSICKIEPAKRVAPVERRPAKQSTLLFTSFVTEVTEKDQ